MIAQGGLTPLQAGLIPLGTLANPSPLPEHQQPSLASLAAQMPPARPSSKGVEVGNSGLADAIFSRLTQVHKLSPEGAVAKMANIQHESGFNPAALHDPDRQGNPTGYGLFGHRLGRRQSLFNFAGSTSPGWQSQVDFAVQELKRDYPSLYTAMRSGGDPRTLAVRFMREFERPASPELKAGPRGNTAAAMMRRFVR